MIRKLFIVFGSGLLLSVLLLSAAWVVGGDEFLKHINHEHRDSGPHTSRTLVFDGSRPLAINGPVNLRFTRGDKSEMIVAGPDSVISKLRWNDSRLEIADSKLWFNDSLDVTIVAPRLVALELAGASDVELVGLDQPALKIDASGAVDLNASGKVRKLDVTASGAGDLDFERVEAEDATIEISGVGDVDLSATGTVNATIAGAGDVTLHRRPKVLTSSISGVGSVDHDYPDAP